mmetsp:Transcript_27945/g.56076  ORF Transcript_27945/g.56076 Transcript_27945/m.56076 type:complete len:81 (-) Transcript_27945:1268-1510(-)
MLRLVCCRFFYKRCIVEQANYSLFVIYCLQHQGCFPPSVASAPPITPYTAAPISPGGNLDPYNVYGLTKGTPITPRDTPM